VTEFDQDNRCCSGKLGNLPAGLFLPHQGDVITVAVACPDRRRSVTATTAPRTVRARSRWRGCAGSRAPALRALVVAAHLEDRERVARVLRGLVSGGWTADVAHQVVALRLAVGELLDRMSRSFGLVFMETCAKSWKA